MRGDQPRRGGGEGGGGTDSLSWGTDLETTAPPPPPPFWPQTATAPLHSVHSRYPFPDRVPPPPGGGGHCRHPPVPSTCDSSSSRVDGGVVGRGTSANCRGEERR